MNIGKWYAVGLSAAVGLTLAGCGGQPEQVDKAVVTVPEPSTTASTTTPPSAPTEPAPTAAKAPEKEAEKTTAAADAGGAEGWGTLKGRVIFNGEPDKPKVLVTKGDKGVQGAEVCAAQEIDSEKLVVDPKTKGLKWAIVYIPKPTKVNKEAEVAAKSAEVVFDQAKCTFVPHVLAAMKGETVMVKSSDAVGHNANSAGLISNRFNTSTQPLQPPSPMVMKGVDARPGLVKCDIHGWMESYWLVLGNPYFAVTDAEGKFEIKNAPAGEQKVVVWAECLGPGTLTPAAGTPVAIKAGGETTQDFTIEKSQVK